MGSLNNLLSGYIDTLMVDTVIANFSNSMSTFGHPLWTNLLANDNHDWTPQRPIKMYYCTGDEQVTFQNAVVAEAAMLANGATDVEAVNMGTSNHNGCVLPALTTAYYWFDGLRNLCNSTGFNEFNTTVSPFAFPNPVKNMLSLNFEGEGFLKVTNIAGKQVHSQLINGNLELSTSNWSKGIYIVEIQNENNRLIQRVVKN
jgi:hypothetical protein